MTSNRADSIRKPPDFLAAAICAVGVVMLLPLWLLMHPLKTEWTLHNAIIVKSVNLMGQDVGLGWGMPTTLQPRYVNLNHIFVGYKYTIDNKTYLQSDEIDLLANANQVDILSNFTVGKTILIKYKPTDPSQSVIVNNSSLTDAKNFHVFFIIVTVFGSILILPMLGIVALHRIQGKG